MLLRSAATKAGSGPKISSPTPVDPKKAGRPSAPVKPPAPRTASHALAITGETKSVAEGRSHRKKHAPAPTATTGGGGGGGAATTTTTSPLLASATDPEADHDDEDDTKRGGAVATCPDSSDRAPDRDEEDRNEKRPAAQTVSTQSQDKMSALALRQRLEGLSRDESVLWMKHVKKHAPEWYDWIMKPPSPTHPTGCKQRASVQLEERLPVAILDRTTAWVEGLLASARPDSTHQTSSGAAGPSKPIDSSTSAPGALPSAPVQCCLDDKQSWEWIMKSEELPSGRKPRTGAAETARLYYLPSLLKSRNVTDARLQLLASVVRNGGTPPPHFAERCQRLCPAACDSKDGIVRVIRFALLSLHAVGYLQRFLDDATDETVTCHSTRAGAPVLLLVHGTDVPVITSHPVPSKRKQDETARANSVGAKKTHRSSARGGGGGGGGGAASGRTVRDEDEDDGADDRATQPERNAKRETKEDEEEGSGDENQAGEGDGEGGAEDSEDSDEGDEEGNDEGDEKEASDGDEDDAVAEDEKTAVDKIRHPGGTKIPVPDCPCKRCVSVRANASARKDRWRQKQRQAKKRAATQKRTQTNRQLTKESTAHTTTEKKKK
jgi:hypothetical protein